MKVLLVTDNVPFEPLGIGYLASALKQDFHNVRYAQYDDSFRAFNKFRPDWVGLSIITGTQGKFIELADHFKKMNGRAKIVAGGPHPTYFPEMINSKSIDYVVRGEGEKAMRGLLRKHTEKIIIGELEQNLDSLKHPDREAIYRGMPGERDNPIKHVIASRGCPFSCPYCYNAGFKELYPGQKTTRRRSEMDVVSEILEIKERYDVKFIQFQDDAFTADRKWLKSFLDVYYNFVELPFHAIVRLDQLDGEIVKDMKRAGLVSVRAAVESGNDYVRTEVLGRKMTKERMRESCEILRRHGIKFMLQNILGLPQCGLKEDLETLEFNRELRPTYAWASIYQPYPKTKLGDASGAQLDSIKPSFYEDSVLDIRDKKERTELRKNFGMLASGRTIEEANREMYLGLIR